MLGNLITKYLPYDYNYHFHRLIRWEYDYPLLEKVFIHAVFIVDLFLWIGSIYFSFILLGLGLVWIFNG